MKPGRVLIATQPHRVMEVKGFAGEGEQRMVLLDQKQLRGEVIDPFAEPPLSMRVPYKTINDLGSVRAPITKTQVAKMMKILSKQNVSMTENWSKRTREHQAHMLSGDLALICEVARDTSLRGRAKKANSPAEMKILNAAMSAIVSEIALATKTSVKEARGRVEEAISRAAMKSKKEQPKATAGSAAS